MVLSRSALRSLLALNVCLLWFAGCNHSTSTSETTTAKHEETGSGGDDTEAPQEKNDKPLEVHGPYYPTVVLKTSMGELTIKLDPQAAPRTVNNFLHYVENGLYNQTIFHQVDAGYVVLGGTYTAELVERPGRYPIPNEASNGRKNLRGTVAMSRQPDNIDSSTSQFFINLQDNPHLDHRGEAAEEYGYCVFGEVVEGDEVLEKIAAVAVEDKDNFQKLPVETVLIESAYRVR
ncbi:MAG TPA: peptidylprolyl isomerase [Pirellulales bacterium]|nr:peptidylprolyl isomerase [Pirellulales bacterium]